ncbi:MAG: hypothetical protein NXY57DRAFT_932816 [Lentinula lateritia]|nr:MAG: hypothetical protein NXY57DRAFT_932816 [Lentinula lateritia]
MKNASLPAGALPVHPVNIVLPLPLSLTPSPTKLGFPFGDPEHRTPLRRRRSSAFAAIKNWTLTVQPGSPAPNSPHKSISVSPGRRSSISIARDLISRKTSISHNRAQSNSSVAHLVELETPGISNYKQPQFDLTDLGYTSIFVSRIYTPSTPSPFLLRDPYPSNSRKQISVQKETPKGLKRIKSLGMLKRNRRKSVSAAAVDVQEPTSRPRSHSRSKSALISAHSKKSSTHPPLPPTLASELLLRQFTDGGSLETHAKRVMEEQARLAAPAGFHKGTALPVGTIYRDENGLIWHDEDERLEREALLSPHTPESPAREWITFNSPGNSPVLPGMALGVGTAEPEKRRGSLASVTSSLSMSPNDIVTPADGSSYFLHSLQPSYAGPPSPLSGFGSTRVPVSPTSTLSTITGMAAATGSMAQNRRTRRRPAPLRLNAPSASNAFDDSFIPSPRAMAVASIAPTGRRRSSTGAMGLSAPPACTEFTSTSSASKIEGDATMKENFKADDLDSASLTTMRSKKVLGMKKISKLNLKSMKSLFGGA